mgnify:CR=1 FL=1
MTAKKASKNSIGLMASYYDDSAWKAREDMRTLKNAREIESDRARLAAAKREAAKEIKDLSKIGGRIAAKTARRSSR